MSSPVSAPSQLASLLAGSGPRAVFQPVVHLATDRIVAYEALARGPEDSPLQSAGALFGAAADEGLVGALDAACRFTTPPPRTRRWSPAPSAS